MPSADAAGDARIGKERKETPSLSPPFVLPKTIRPEIWAEFERNRNRLRKPMTDHARNLIIKDLDALREKGYDSNAVLDQSSKLGYQGVFPVKPVFAPNPSPPAPKPKEWWETDRGIEEKAKQLGIAPEETLAMLKARVFMAVGDGPWFAKLDGVVAGYIQDFSQQDQRERSA